MNTSFVRWISVMAMLAANACAASPADPDAAAAWDPCEGVDRAHCVEQVSLGAHFGCAILGDHTVWCWGRNDESQLGYGSTSLCPEVIEGGETRSVACHPFPLQVLPLGGATGVAAGDAHACVVLTTGRIACWGSNTAGQLGNGDLLASAAPVAVAGIEGATQVALGARHACAITNGTVWCWGANDRGQLGSPSDATCTAGADQTPCRRTPQRVAGLTNVLEIAAGDAHTCARVSGGAVWCWGTNTDGELGNGSTGEAPSMAPVAVRFGGGDGTSIRALAAGAHHTCALRDDGAVLCWGRNDHGQLGLPTSETSFASCTNACSVAPVLTSDFVGTRPASELDAGISFDAGDAGDVRNNGDSGDANALDGTSGIDVRDATAVDASTVDASTADGPQGMNKGGTGDVPIAAGIAAGIDFSCARVDDGSLRCWGANSAGQLGNGAMDEGGSFTVAVIAVAGSAATNTFRQAALVAAGGRTACARTTDRQLRCWGSNEDGALGEGTVISEPGPVAVTW